MGAPVTFRRPHRCIDSLLVNDAGDRWRGGKTTHPTIIVIETTRIAKTPRVLMHTAELRSQFLADCTARGLAPATVAQYAWALGRLTDQCEEYPSIGRDLLPVLDDAALALESRRDLLKCLKTFFGWCVQTHALPNPCDGLRPIPHRRNWPRVLTEEEIALLMKASNTPRDRALLLVVLDSGLRVSEVASIRRQHVRDGWLVVTGKVGTRQVPISTKVATLLEEIGDEENIWLGQRGPLSKSGVKLSYKRMFRRAGIMGPKAGPHTLRHTFGTFYIRNGGQVSQLRIIMGHSKLETTMIYVHLSGRDVLADHALHSPAKTLGLIDNDQAAKEETVHSETPDVTVLHGRISADLHKKLRFLMAADGMRFTPQVVRAVREYVAHRRATPHDRPAALEAPTETKSVHCRIPSELHRELRGWMVADGTGVADQLALAVRY